MTISSVSTTNNHNLIHFNTDGCLEKEVKIALKALESTRDRLSLKIDDLKAKSREYDVINDLSCLESLNETIAKKKKIKKLSESILSNTRRAKNEIPLELAKVKKDRLTLISNIGLFNSIKASRWIIFDRLEKINKQLPEKYHGKTFNEVSSKLADDLKKIDDKLAELEKETEKLEVESLLCQRKIKQIEDSIFTAYKIYSLETLEGKARYSETRLLAAAETEEQIETLSSKLTGINHQISKKKAELQSILNVSILEKPSRAKESEVPEPQYILDNLGEPVGRVVGVPGPDIIKYDFSENRSMTKWEQFKDLILRIINSIKHLFKNPDLA